MDQNDQSQDKLLINLGQMWLSLAQLRLSLFSFLDKQKRASTSSWAQGPHMVKSIPAWTIDSTLGGNKSESQEHLWQCLVAISILSREKGNETEGV